MTDDPGYVHYKRTGQLRTTADCRRYGHRMDDGSLPTCTRVGCDEGMAAVWMYCEMEVEQCTCGTDKPCDWHEIVPAMQAENYAEWGEGPMTPTGPDHATPPELRGLPRSSYARSHAVPSDYRSCDLCHGDIEPAERGPLCGACRDWDDYWTSLTPAEQAEELAMMDAYASEMVGEAG